MSGLAEAIPDSNVRFRLLKQMGYDPAARGGGAEAVGIEIRRLRARLRADPAGAPQPETRTWEAAEREGSWEVEMMVELRARQSTQWRGRRLVWDYRKAEAALVQLKNRGLELPTPEGEEKWWR